MSETRPPGSQKSNSYGEILKSSILVGGSSVVNVAFGIVRNKVMALLLGPAGFGLVGLYVAVADLAQSIVGLGINSSGVRQIAEAVATGDSDRIGRTITVLRRMSIMLALLGTIAMVAFSNR